MLDRPSDGTWVELKWKGDDVSSVPSPRGAHATAVVEGRTLWLFGGDNGAGSYFNDLFRIDLETQSCVKVRASSGSKPSKRGWHSMCAHKHRLYVFGGTDGSITFNDLHVFDTLTHSWSCPVVSGEPPEPLFSHSAVVIEHEMFIFGGSNGSSKAQNQPYIFDIERSCWIHPKLSGDVPSPRYGHSCVLMKDSIFLYGGYSGGTFAAQMYCLSLARRRHDMASVPREAINSLIHDFRSLVDNPDSFWDVQLLLEDRVIRAHRSILAARSRYFANMFSSGLREGISSRDELFP